MCMGNQFVSFNWMDVTTSKYTDGGKKVNPNEDKDFQVLMNKLGSNAPGLKLSCAWFNADFSDFFFLFFCCNSTREYTLNASKGNLWLKVQFLPQLTYSWRMLWTSDHHQQSFTVREYKIAAFNASKSSLAGKIAQGIIGLFKEKYRKMLVHPLVTLTIPE